MKLLNLLWIIPLCGFLYFFVLFCIFTTYYILFEKKRRKKRLEKSKYRKISALKRFLWLFPKQLALDFIERDPNYFTPNGIIVFTGRQGTGKTISLVKYILDLKALYPKAKVLANLGINIEHENLNHWKQLITENNGIFGLICVIDELQNWFSSNQSKDFPPEMLEVITQNRKNRRIILGTSQVFTRLSKPIREQTTEVRRCITLFGCITFVHRVIPELDSSGEVVKWKHKGFYFFVQNQKLRDSYDTYEVVKSFLVSGFKEEKKIRWVT